MALEEVMERRNLCTSSSMTWQLKEFVLLHLGLDAQIKIVILMDRMDKKVIKKFLERLLT